MKTGPVCAALLWTELRHDRHQVSSRDRLPGNKRRCQNNSMSRHRHVPQKITIICHDARPGVDHVLPTPPIFQFEHRPTADVILQNTMRLQIIRCLGHPVLLQIGWTGAQQNAYGANPPGLQGGIAHIRNPDCEIDALLHQVDMPV